MKLNVLAFNSFCVILDTAVTFVTFVLYYVLKKKKQSWIWANLHLKRKSGTFYFQKALFSQIKLMYMLTQANQLNKLLRYIPACNSGSWEILATRYGSCLFVYTQKLCCLYVLWKYFQALLLNTAVLLCFPRRQILMILFIHTVQLYLWGLSLKSFVIKMSSV